MDLEKLRRFCDDFYMKMVYNIYWGAVWEGDYYLLNFPRFGGGELGWQLSPLGCRPFLLPTRERHHTREMVLCRDEPPI